ncbi:hypothetical protein HY970_02810 [Candidatus Kaiserbacteria bacterium]|nr:hypothetical protein [Candidatus Kaiserbacteria bacterium]
MRTVSQAVERILEKTPFLAEVVAEGVGNNAAIARKLRPHVEEYLFENVSESSISMALHRVSKRRGVQPYGTKLLKLMKDITVRSNLIEFTCPNSLASVELFEALSKSAKRHKDAFLNYSRGLHESILIVSRDLEGEVAAILKGQKGITRKDGLSAITMRLPENSLTVPGVYYPILKAIALEGISLVEVMSVLTEFSIIFEDRDVDRAFSVIKRITS